MAIEIDFSYVIDGSFASVNYYRSLTPMNVGSMPAATATGITATTYTDKTAANNTIYYVRFGSVRAGVEKISSEISVYTGNGDRYWDKVKVLMHFNSSSGSSTSFYEQKNGVFLPRLGSTYVENGGRFEQGVFFGRSGARAIQIPSAYYKLGAQDFTIEVSLKFTQLNQNSFYDICGQRENYSSNQSYAFYYYTGNGKFHFEFSSNGTSMSYVTFDHIPQINTYEDYQLVRIGNALNLRVNGVTVGSAALPSGFVFFESTAYHQLALSAQHVASSNQPSPIWFDEFRVTIGVARDAAVLTSEFKDHY